MKSDFSREELERIERQLFRSLSRDDPSHRARRLVAGALGIAAVGAASTGAAGVSGVAPHGATVAKVGAALLVKWAGVGVVAAVASLGAVKLIASSVATPRAGAGALLAGGAPTSTPAAARRVPLADPEALPAPRAPVSEEARAAAPTRPPLPKAGARPAPHRVLASDGLSNDNAIADATTSIAPSRLAAEVALLDEARGAVARQDGGRAVRLCESYSQRFPDGVLTLEATVLLVEALFLQGQSERATVLAREVLRLHGASAHASRIRYLLTRHTNP